MSRADPVTFIGFQFGEAYAQEGDCSDRRVYDLIHQQKTPLRLPRLPRSFGKWYWGSSGRWYWGP